MFYSVFLSDTCLGKACYEKCKYKYDKSSADIRIGDAWGKLYHNNEKGVSIAIAFTSKGNNLLNSLNCHLEAWPFEELTESQMRSSPQIDRYHKIVSDLVSKSETTIEEIADVCRRKHQRELWKYRCTHPCTVIKYLCMKSVKRMIK